MKLRTENGTIMGKSPKISHYLQVFQKLAGIIKTMTRQQYINRTLRALTGEKRPATPWQYHHTCRMAEAVSTVYRFDEE